MLSQSVMHRGTPAIPTSPEIVRAGPITARFEPDGIFLRHIRLGDREILRGIYVAVRDQNWNTIAPAVTSLDVSSSRDSFSIDVEVHCNEREIDFAWTGKITGAGDGTIRYSMDGIAQSSFWRNRIGILVLHPPRECAGQSCVIESPDGTRSTETFPDSIAPHQPFFNIRAMTHQVLPGIDAEVRFSGDIFETEDQRNWTDASYKTYSTPLELPFPVLIEEGTTVSQSIELRLTGDIPELQAESDPSPIRLSPSGAEPVPIPPIGLGMSTTQPDLTQKQIERLRRLNLGHMRVDLHLNRPEHIQLAERAWQQAEALDVPLQPALFLQGPDDPALRNVIEWLAENEAFVTEWLMFSQTAKVTDRETVDQAAVEIATCDPGAVVCSGTNAYFTELNRERPDTEALDAICYSINPQVHAFDDLSLVETLEAQSWTVESAKRFAGDSGIIVGPITLRPRFNPNATGPESGEEQDELPSSVDPRQMSLLGAGWALGSLKYISLSGVACGTWFETIGLKGVMEAEQGSLAPERFPSLPDSVFPMYHVFADFGEFRDGRIVKWDSSDPLVIDGCVLQKGDRTALLLANLSDREQEVTVELPSEAENPRVRVLDESNGERAMTDPEGYRVEPGEPLPVDDGSLTLTLRPFAVLRLDH